MSWTEERIALLERMWLEGHPAGEIAERLGGVSRNAVIGKAHRLGLENRSLMMQKLLTKVQDLPVSDRLKTLIRNDNIIYVGDVVQRTEAEWLRVPLFGRKTLDELKAAISEMNLWLGMDLPDWPPETIDQEVDYAEVARRVAELQQTRGGATFEAIDGRFAMATTGDEDDLAAALKPINQQMQKALLQKSRNFAELARRLDNQVGWSGISRTVDTLCKLLDRPPEEIADSLGYLYPTAIELGSFIELDQQLASSDSSFASALDPEVRRPLSDLVRSLAPWLRAFPTVREMDDEANRFLVRAAELGPAFEIVEVAKELVLLSDRDLEVFRQLHDSAVRGNFQGEKAGGQASRSAKNLVICAMAFLGSFYTGAVSSDVATTSPLVHKAGQFIVRAEKSVTELVADLPGDLRYSIAEFIKEFPGEPPLRPDAPQIVQAPHPPTRRRTLSP